MDTSTASMAPEIGGESSTSTGAPIQYENFTREHQNITMQDNFDGFRVEAGKAVTKYLQASHSLFLGTQLKETGYLYQFGPTFALDDGSLVLTARSNFDGVINGRVIKRLSKGWEIKTNFNSSLTDETRNMYELALDHTRTDWAGSLKLAWQGTWILNGAFSQVITPRLQLGGELTLITSNGASIGSVGGRYQFGKNIITGQLARHPDFKNSITSNTHSCKMQFVRKITDRLSMSSELEYSHPEVESTMKIGWEYLFRHARVQGLLDTAGRISVSAQDFSGFGISGMIDYVKNDYKFGFMMHVMPNQEQTPAPTKEPQPTDSMTV